MATPAVTADGRARVLADGNEIPLLALGVWQVPDGPDCENAVRWALELGYRHIDTAQAYGNEASVGRGLRDSGVPRDEVFITTKFYPDRKDPEAEVQRSLERLGVDQVDLYIIHWPGGGPGWAWPGMERARERGFARSIGVSNFSLAELDQLLLDVTTPPVINQVQFSPFAFRRRLLQGARSVASRWRPTARWAPAAISATGASARSPSASGARRRRSCCAGACSATWSSCPSPPTASGSSRTLASLTSCCLPRTWPRSTPSTRPVAPTAPSSTTGGDDPPRLASPSLRSLTRRDAGERSPWPVLLLGPRSPSTTQPTRPVPSSLGLRQAAWLPRGTFSTASYRRQRSRSAQAAQPRVHPANHQRPRHPAGPRRTSRVCGPQTG